MKPDKTTQQAGSVAPNKTPGDSKLPAVSQAQAATAQPPAASASVASQPAAISKPQAAPKPAFPALSTTRTTTVPFSPSLTSPTSATPLVSPRQSTMSQQAFSQTSLNGLAHLGSSKSTAQPRFKFGTTSNSQSHKDSTIAATSASSRPIGTPASSSASRTSVACELLIRGLPVDTSEEAVSLMLLFVKKELLGVEVVAGQPKSAIVKFSTQSAAQQAKDMLHGKSIGSNDVSLVVEYVSGSPPSATPYRDETKGLPQTTRPSPTSLSARSHLFTKDAFPSDNTRSKLSSLADVGLYNSRTSERDASAKYASIYSPQSPIGNHLPRGRVSGKDLIHDTANDDEDQDLLKNPLAFAEKEPIQQQRRSTLPQLPTQRMAHLSLNTNATGPSSLPPYVNQSMTPVPYANHMNPAMMMNGANGMQRSMPYVDYGHGPFNGRRARMPASNPADQHPPCNTLYVGNLPVNTSEEELKCIFSRVRGYKRLCFRAKSMGPMCFVEFEDISTASKALSDLYGIELHNSIKGGIRLSYSKNPLGVRNPPGNGAPTNGHMPHLNGHMAASTNGFTNAHRPPPGLSAPSAPPSAPPGFGGSNYNGNYSNNSANGMNPPYSVGYANGNSNLFNGSIGNTLYPASDPYPHNAAPTPVNGSGIHGQSANGAYMNGATMNGISNGTPLNRASVSSSFH
ncbi:hypothetical protein GGR57DRAFT_118944 [Xylariaceae sp. FL1272]|nr:hypothetical protein GGR57DRAFT_118944 [Xylariaceae sp. FL1272]